MQLTLTGHQIEITEPIRTYATDKIKRIEKHFDNVTSTNIVLHVEKTRHLAEATLYTKGVTLHANAEGEDMYAAIDSLADKIDRQILKHKEKTTDHHRGDGGIKKQNML